MNRDYKEPNCPICFEELNDSFIPLFPCGHYIHQECVAKTDKPICPLCQSDVFVKSLYEKNKNTIRELEKENTELQDELDELNDVVAAAAIKEKKQLEEKLNPRIEKFIYLILIIIIVLAT